MKRLLVILIALIAFPAFAADTTLTQTGAQVQTAITLVESMAAVNGIMKMNGSGVPSAASELAISEQQVVGRATGGSLTGLAIDADLSSVSANDDTVPSAKATKAMGDLKLPLAGGTMTGTTVQPDAGGVKLTISNSDGKYSGIFIARTCHETIAFGKPVFINSDGEVALANATAASTMPVIGLAVIGGNAADTCTILTHGTVSETDWTWTVGGVVYADDSASGAMTQTVGDIAGTDHVVQVIGVALHADTMLVMPSLSLTILE